MAMLRKVSCTAMFSYNILHNLQSLVKFFNIFVVRRKFKGRGMKQRRIREKGKIRGK